MVTFRLGEPSLDVIGRDLSLSAPVDEVGSLADGVMVCFTIARPPLPFIARQKKEKD
jgi:hypothetical protein